MNEIRDQRLALGLLAVGVVAYYAWRAAPPEHLGRVWNISQSLLILVLLCGWAVAWWRTPVRDVCALLAAYQIMTAGCSLAYIYKPWVTLAPGQGQCQRLLDIPLSAIGGTLALVLAWRLYSWSRSNGRRPH